MNHADAPKSPLPPGPKGRKLYNPSAAALPARRLHGRATRGVRGHVFFEIPARKCAAIFSAELIQEILVEQEPYFQPYYPKTSYNLMPSPCLATSRTSQDSTPGAWELRPSDMHLDSQVCDSGAAPRLVVHRHPMGASSAARCAGPGSGLRTRSVPHGWRESVLLEGGEARIGEWQRWKDAEEGRVAPREQRGHAERDQQFDDAERERFRRARWTGLRAGTVPATSRAGRHRPLS